MSETTCKGIFLKKDSKVVGYMVYPRFLLGLELNETAKLIYVLMLDRARLSIILFLDKKIKNLFIAGCKSCAAYGGKKSITRHFSAAMPPGHFPSGPIKRFYRFIRNKYKTRRVGG